MRYEARFTAYDVLDHVQVALVVYGIDDDDPTRSTKRLVWGRQYPGRGESDATRWAAQLLEQTWRDLQAAEKRPPLEAAPRRGPHTISDVAEGEKSEDG